MVSCSEVGYLIKVESTWGETFVSRAKSTLVWLKQKNLDPSS